MTVTSLSWRQIVRQVQAAPTLDGALAAIVRGIETALPVDACAVYLADSEGEQFVLTASAGLNATSVGRQSEVRERLVSLVVQRRELVLATDDAVEPRHAFPPAADEERRGSFLGMPLIHYQRLLGVLAAWKAPPRRFEKDEVTFFVTIAAHLANAIHEAGAADEVHRMLNGEVPNGSFIQGVPAAGGIAIGTVAVVGSLADLGSIPDREVRDVVAEERSFRTAVADVQRELSETVQRLAPVLQKEVTPLFDVYIMLLGDDVLVSQTVDRIRAGNWACGAWSHVVTEHANVFEQMEDPYLRARADDVREIGQRILSRLQADVREPRQFPERCILVGEALGIAEIATVPSGRLAGIVCSRGSALSHTAILARALGIPAVVSLATLPAAELDGSEMVIDGDEGRICVRPSRAVVDLFRARIDAKRVMSARLTALRTLPAVTSDRARLPLYANVGLAADLAAAHEHGAEGVGLYRTEYPFLLRETFPLEDEQYEIYRAALESFAGKPVTLRTLDVGGDKILPYYREREDNPSLGRRGIRFSLDHPEIFVIQLRAMLRANAGLDNLHVLFPMISTVGEVDEAQGLLARAHRELMDEGHASARPRVGVMIEVPSAVYLADALVKRVDFVSVGTNDLTQYLLAADRNNPEVTTPYDGLHPAVLIAIDYVVKAAHLQRKQVSVCGEMAGDPAGALVLLGMGVDTLSMSPARLPRVKLAIRSVSLLRARALLDTALCMEDGFAIARLLDGALREAGLTRAPLT
jgi:phosphotransferase system enzyme I (PtsP)